MKTVVNIGIGGRCFTIDEDAYTRLKFYLDTFRKKTGQDYQTNEIMDEIESRIAEIFSENLSTSRKEVVDICLVNEVITRMGMPDGSSPSYSAYCHETTEDPVKRLYRDPSNKMIGGVCSGLAAYLNIDITIFRVLFLVALFCGSVGLWIYIIFWIVAPMATTAAQKCEMRGIPATAENMARFTSSKL